jgi:hypothetical protein
MMMMMTLSWHVQCVIYLSYSYWSARHHHHSQSSSPHPSHNIESDGRRGVVLSHVCCLNKRSSGAK